MNNKLKNIIISISFIFVLVGFMVSNIFLVDKEISYEERRKLLQLPKFTVEKLINGEYFQDMEKYFLDQFTLRENFRKIKAFINREVFKEKDNNNIYIIDDSIYKIEYPLKESSIYNSATLYNKISSKYFKNSKVYYTIVPDKNYFVPEDKGYLNLDYEKLIDIMKKNTKDMKYIDIIKDLKISDYYHTDLHWKQENLIPVAQNLITEMKNKVYNEKYEECKVYDFEKQKYIKVYDDKDFENVDSYDVYLGGAKPLLSIENPNNKSGKELYIFRDSFGSSLSPLLINEYSKIILVDLRYINSTEFEKYIQPKENSDVLFMYNTLI